MSSATRLRVDRAGIEVRLRPSPRARRFTLRLETGGAGAVLTLPEGVCEREARAFLDRHSDWLARAVAARPAPVRVAPGMRLPLDGAPVPVLSRAGRGAARLTGRGLELPDARPPGPTAAAFLRAHARDRIAPEARACAERLGRSVAGISFRDTVSRWGSCSATRRLSFSWRLAMAPPEVQRYLAAHEAAHLVEMNHSARFWRVVAGLMPDYERPRAWLKREGRALHRYRFEA